jgi:methylated-DNA-[protein]-cysteine S-methyltransferase
MTVYITWKHRLIGEMLLIAEYDRLIYSGYTDSDPAKENKKGAKRAPENPALLAAVKQLEEYLEGKRTRLDVSLEIKGSEFQRQVYQLVREIPIGGTMSYSELASKLKKPGAARSIGAAIGKNPLLLFVPDHRVISHGGGIGGFSGKWNRKPGLLELEERLSKKTKRQMS